MAFTQDDIELLERAYIRLNTGEQEIEVEYSDGRRVRYAQAKDIEKALQLARAEYAASIQPRRRPRGYRINVSKGL